MKPKSVLLVDDNKRFLESAIRFLTNEAQFAIVGWAFSAEDAMGKINKYKPEILLMDLALPDINGLSLTRKLKSSSEAPKIIVLSLYDDLEYRIEAEAAGADGFISKSDFGTKLIPLIESLFRESVVKRNHS